MDIAFRVDASSLIATGHFFRCLTLAEALKQSGWRVSFVCRHLPDELQTMLSERGIAFSKIGGFEPSKMSADLRHSHWLGTFSSPGCGRYHPRLVRDRVGMVDRRSLCARSTVGDRAESIGEIYRGHRRPGGPCARLRYGSRSSAPHAQPVRRQGARWLQAVAGSGVCVGARGVQGRSAPRPASRRRGKTDFDFLGGVDAGNHTSQAIEAVAGLGVADLRVDVVVGSANQHSQEIRSQCIHHGFVCHFNTDRMGELMAAADLAIGAGGVATWERCSLGLPTLAICTAENQKQQIITAACDGLLFAPSRETTSSLSSGSIRSC